MTSKSRYGTALIILAVFAVIFAIYKWGGTEKDKPVNLENLPAEVAENVEKVSGTTNVFKHPDLGFSFEYPNDYGITELPDEAGEIVLIQKEGKGLQVYISDFPADVPVNASLIRQELAGANLSNLQDITVGGAAAASFASADPSIGDTLEVWFSSSGTLYQITAQPEHRKLLDKVVSTWKFN